MLQAEAFLMRVFLAIVFHLNDFYLTAFALLLWKIWSQHTENK